MKEPYYPKANSLRPTAKSPRICAERGNLLQMKYQGRFLKRRRNISS